MAKRRTADTSAASEPVSDTNGTADNGQAPRKTVRKFSVPCGKDEHLHVEVVESEHQTKEGKITILSAVAHRTYLNGGGEEKISYSYRAHHIGLLRVLLDRAFEFIVSTRTVDDVPFN